MAKSKQKPEKPLMEAPEDLEDEALLEWERVCKELADIGRLARCDRAVLVQYCELWAINRRAARKVANDGFATLYSNGNEGVTPAFTVMSTTARQLRTLLNDLGLTPSTRKAKATEGDGTIGDF